MDLGRFSTFCHRPHFLLFKYFHLFSYFPIKIERSEFWSAVPLLFFFVFFSLPHWKLRSHFVKVGGYSTLSTLVLIFNLLILFSVAKNKYLHYTTHYVMVTLALRCADKYHHFIHHHRTNMSTILYNTMSWSQLP